MATKILDSNGVQILTTKIFTETDDRIDTAIETATATDDEVTEALDEVFNSTSEETE